MTKTKIAYLISTLDTGGAERQLVTTLDGLDYNKFDVTVFVLKNRLKLKSQVHSEVKIEVLGVQSFLNFVKLIFAIRKIKKFNPAILHSVMYASNLLARVYKIFNKKCYVINHIHGLGTWIRPIHIMLDRSLLSYVDKLLVVSKKSYDLRLQRERYPETKLQILYNSINTDIYEPKASNNSSVVLGSACRLVGLKQIDGVIKMISALRALGINVKYRIAGDGVEKENLIRLAQDEDVEDHVEFCGMVSDMNEFYASIDVFILNSRTEDLPLSIIEAYAAGKYVIAPNVGGIKELITSDTEALLFDNNTESPILDEIVSFLNNIDTNQVSIKNRKFVERKFDDSLFQSELLKIYKRLD